MKVLLYRGKSLISRAIQFQTRSPYSHVAIQLDDSTVIEAWHLGGVRRLRYPLEGHSAGTVIDFFRFNPSLDCDADSVRAFLFAQLGKRYDFLSVLRFLSRRKAPANDAWFCSELCLEAFGKGGLWLLHANPAETTPRDIALSPYLIYEKTIGG